MISEHKNDDFKGEDEPMPPAHGSPHRPTSGPTGDNSPLRGSPAPLVNQNHIGDQK